MYYLLGIQNNLENIIALTKPYFQGPISTSLQLKQAYVNMLTKLQPNTWHPVAAVENNLIYDVATTQKLIKTFSKPSSLDDKSIDMDHHPTRGAIEDALKKLQESLPYLKSWDPQLASLLQLVVYAFFYTNSKGQAGGSTSAAVGAIWYAHRKNWSMYDIIEFLVHELTHNLLFIDELRYGHYQSTKILEDPKNFATSAILKEKRPLDKAFHALIVAFEIANFRTIYGKDSKVYKAHSASLTSLIQSVKQSSKEVSHLIASNNQLVTARFKYLLAACQEGVARLANIPTQHEAHMEQI